MKRNAVVFMFALVSMLMVIDGRAQEEPKAEKMPAPARIWADALNMFSSGDSITIDEVILHGIAFTNLQCRFEQHDGKFMFRNIKADVAGGIISGFVIIDFNHYPVRFDVDLAFEKVELDRLARRFKFVKEKSKGVLSGKFAIRGEGNRFDTYQGSGEGHIVDMEFGDTPIIFKIIDVFSLLDFRKDSFRTADFTFVILNKKFEVKSMKFESKRLSLEKGKGYIGFDGDTDLYFTIRSQNRLFDSVPVVGRVLSFTLNKMGQYLSSVRVSGPISKPSFSLVPLKGLLPWGKKNGDADEEKKDNKR